MSSPARPQGPRSRPGSNKDHSSSAALSPPSLSIQPLQIPKKKPKLQLAPINTREVSGDEHSYYNLGQQLSQPAAIPIPIPASQSQSQSQPRLTISAHGDNNRTLRPPMSKEEPGSFFVGQIREVLTEIEHRSDSRMSKRSSGNADQVQTSSSSPVSVRQQSSSTENSVSTSATTAPSESNNGWDNEKWSDDVLEVVSRLGEGAGGAVYKVKDKRTGDLYARKTIPTRTTPARQLLAELRHLSNTRHGNICEFYGAYMSSSSSEVNVVMELCEGGSLEAVMAKLKERQARASEELIGKLAEGILNGLVHLHSLKIIHRDIKPSNILLSLSSNTGAIKLCDFGVSGDLQDSLVVTFLGTSWYMAPERVNGKPYSVRADVWSTGLSLLELALNRFPLPDDLDGIIPLMDYITRGPPIELVDDGDVKWSQGAKDFISLCLRVSDADRPHPKELLQHPWVIECSSVVSERAVRGWVKDVLGRRPRKNPQHSSSTPPLAP